MHDCDRAHRLWVDQDTGAHLVERLLLVRPSHGVLHAGAAALPDIIALGRGRGLLMRWCSLVAGVYAPIEP
jgi:hypothetical protein